MMKKSGGADDEMLCYQTPWGWDLGYDVDDDGSDHMLCSQTMTDHADDDGSDNMLR